MDERDKTCACGHGGHEHDAGECWAEVDDQQCPCNWWEPINR